MGFSILGVLIGTLASALLGLLVALGPTLLPYLMQGGALIAPIAGVVSSALIIIYTAKFYPSYFTDRPVLKSSRAISFANLMVGTWLLGFIWNGNLTKGRKGVSHKVTLVVSVLACACFVLQILVASSLSAISGIQPLERTAGADVYTDAETGASLVVPDAWSEVPTTVAGRKAKFRVPDPGGTVFYSSRDEWSRIPEENRPGASRESVDMDYLSDEDAQRLLGDYYPLAGARRVTLNGEEYFLVSTAGVMGVSAFVHVLRIDNGYVYDFQYSDGGVIDCKALRTFYSMIASTVYP